MTYEPGKRNLTTGDVAKLCGVNFRTVIRWIQRGHLKAYHLPGRGDNRILVKDFVEFLREHRLPVPEELAPPSTKVLVVENDPQTAKAMQRALNRKGFVVGVATDGFLAGSLATSLKPAVMTLDPRMPGLGGLATLKALRANPELVGLKVLVVSEMAEKELQAALSAGADDVLEKPFENRTLVAKVARLAGIDLEG